MSQDASKVTKVVEFEGIPSGDNACFCWLVDAETYVKLKGHTPRPHDRAKCRNTDEYDSEELYRVYPMFGGREKRHKYRFEFTETEWSEEP